MAPELSAALALAPVAGASLLMAFAGVMVPVSLTYGRKRRPMPCALAGLLALGAVVAGLVILTG